MKVLGKRRMTNVLSQPLMLPPTLTPAAAGLAPIADASEAWRPSTVRPATGAPQKPDATAGGRHLRLGPLPHSCIAAIASYSITSSALTSSAGDVIRQRRRLFFPRVFPRVLVEHAQHCERHGLTPGLDGRLRHRREQGRVVSRQLRTFALACGSDALRLVDAASGEHRRHARH